MRKYFLDEVREYWGSMIVDELIKNGRALVVDENGKFCLLFQVGFGEFALRPLHFSRLDLNLIFRRLYEIS